MNIVKGINTRNVAGSALIFLALSCTKQSDKVNIITGSPTPATVEMDGQSQLTSIVKRNQGSEADTLSSDSLLVNIECYRWDGEFHASTQVVNEEDNSVYDLNILITLYNTTNNDYEGGLVLYIDEENFVEAVVRGKAEGNRITIYYVESEENSTENLFKDGDKLVQYELVNGEFSASWYKSMHRFVNEHTVISMK